MSNQSALWASCDAYPLHISAMYQVDRRLARPLYFEIPHLLWRSLEADLGSRVIHYTLVPRGNIMVLDCTLSISSHSHLTL